MDYRHKYIKYKKKYLNLRNKLDRENTPVIISRIEDNFSIDDKITQSNNNFTNNVFYNFDTSANIFSPMSLTFSLALLQLAAGSETDKSLTKFLGYKYSLDDINYLFNIMNSSIMKLSNLLVVNNKYSINQEYRSMLNGIAVIVQDDFITNKKLISQKVNEFVEFETNAMIKNVINNSDIDNKSVFIMVNTIYFKANWKHKFPVDNTTKMRFHRTQEDVIDMMYQVNSFNYYENKALQLIELPYNDEDYVMGIILPKVYNTDNVDYTINNVPMFSPAEINEFINNCQYSKVELYVPKFTQRKRYEFVPILKKMGLTHLFNKNDTDLNIMAKDAYISRIIHEAVVVIDEIGTEAAATTIVIGQAMATRPVKQKIKVFKADHAFIYYIRHQPTGLFLFFGDYQG
ncbi:serpin [Acanthamoeba polyphaga mimivirus]|nr:serpin [Mimivirus reunion]WMV62081.1 serpin [Mimivirus sp.]WMV63058.1 serpin [Acanthamoeba polyphaga mimivirus]WMV64035.1 serpin [Mimivirus sp.]